ncbi:phage major capsid protein [Granulicoccus phenolivorans]|uniref:phage major capsid protein n=1 Tax=Granulicoccus phenolivorans TaxID=266854 RepID=UPI0004010A23|nr:phage major capsid protein [Granulicoccus phenolivorans]
MTVTTTTSAISWSPDVVALPPQDAIPDALVMQCATVLGSADGDAPVVRVPYVDDTSLVAGFTPEGTNITLSEPDLSEVAVSTGKVSCLLRISREQLEQANAQELIVHEMAKQIIKSADVAFLNQTAPVPPAVIPPTGVLASSISDAGEVSGNLDTLIDAVSWIQASGGTPSHILLSPLAWAELRKLKVTTGSAQSLLGAGSGDAASTLLGIPVLVTFALEDTEGLVLDRRSIAAAASPVEYATSEHAYFTADSYAIRGTFRFGAKVMNGERVVKFTVKVPTP